MQRRYAAKMPLRGITNVRTMLHGDDSFPKNDLPKVIENLRKVRESLDVKLISKKCFRARYRKRPVFTSQPEYYFR